MTKFREAWTQLNPTPPKGRPNLLALSAYGDTHDVAEGLRRAGPDLTHKKLVDALATPEDDRISEVASSRTFTTWNHIGNLPTHIMVVPGQHWLPPAWAPTHPSEICDDLKKA
jgi:hypothetical protein